MSLGYHSHGIYRRTPFLLDWDPYEGWEYAESGSDIVLRPVTVRGLLGTHTRNSIQTAIDKNGSPYVVPKGFPAFHHIYNTTSGLWVPKGVLRERAGTNLAADPEALSLWDNFNTPNSVTDNAKKLGCVSLSLVTGDANEGKQKTTTALTGDAVKAFSIFVAMHSASTFRFILIDDTAGVSRANFTVQFTSASDPTSIVVTATTGTNLLDHLPKKAEWCYDIATGQYGYRIWWQTTTATAANTHKVRVFALNTGYSMYIGGAQVEDHPLVSSYMKAARVATNITFPWNVLPRNCTPYSKGAELGTFQTVGARSFQVGDDDSGTASSARVHCATAGDVRHTYENASAVDEDADASTGAVALFDDHEIRAPILAAAVKVGRRINGGTEATGTAGAALAHPSTYAEAVVSLTPHSTYAGAETIERFRIGDGEMTFDQLTAGL